jgi:rhomboid-like protein
LWASFGDGEKIVMGIMALNTAVFLAWRSPKLQPILFTFFCANPFSRNHNLTFMYSPQNHFLLHKTGVVCGPMVLSTFSHVSKVHIALNMLSLHTWGVPVSNSMGKEQFLAFYLSAGVFSSLFSYIAKIASGIPSPTLGAVSTFVFFKLLFFLLFFVVRSQELLWEYLPTLHLHTLKLKCKLH